MKLVAACAWVIVAMFAKSAGANDMPSPDSFRQSRDDAWWTGPILAAGASTLPKGHTLVEPYVFDVMRKGRFDSDGHRHDALRRDGFGSLTYVLYGLVDGLTVGVIPRFSYNDVRDGADSSRVGVGDFTVQGTIRLLQFNEASHTPTTSLVIQESLPTGKYDRLGARPNDGAGSGAHTTTASLNSQYFLWMPNGRILRTRLNIQYAISDTVSVEDVSVYGTSVGFRGHAKPGNAFVIDSAWEYSLTRNWVLALDVQYEHDANTAVRGLAFRADSGSSEVFTLAPAVEFNFNSRIGVIAGALITPAGRNASAIVAPVVALNMVF